MASCALQDNIIWEVYKITSLHLAIPDERNEQWELNIEI